jgi:hypothetical protein
MSAKEHQRARTEVIGRDRIDVTITTESASPVILVRTSGEATTCVDMMNMSSMQAVATIVMATSIATKAIERAADTTGLWHWRTCN